MLSNIVKFKKKNKKKKKNKIIKSKKLKKIVIRIYKNNVFCSYINLKSKKFLFVTSAGKQKLQLTKSKHKYNTYIIINSFFKRIRPFLNSKIEKYRLLLDLIVPIHLRFIFLKKISKFLRKKRLLIYLNPKKCFNGCKARKKRRTGKQKKIKLFKY